MSEGAVRQLVEGDVSVQVPASPDDDTSPLRLAVHVAGRPVATVELFVAEARPWRTGSLSWLLPGWPSPPVAAAATRLAVGYAFDVLALERVEMRIPASDESALRAAGRAGLRREGVLRGAGGSLGNDLVLLARLRDDPEPVTRAGFVGVLNAFLPRKRVIGQALIRDIDGRVLLCEHTYKPEWDLPGGVVEPGESPLDAAVRETREELGLNLPAGPLLAVNWMPPWREWDDACAFVFDLGAHPGDLVSRMRLQPTEILAVHWCDRDLAARQAGPATAAVLTQVWDHRGPPLYLHAGDPPG